MEPVPEQGPREIRLQARAVNALVARLNLLEETRLKQPLILIHDPVHRVVPGKEGRLAGLDDAELMTGVAGRAVAGAAIGIDVAHAHIRPRIRCWPVVFIKHNFCAVALHTAGLARGILKFRMLLTLMYLH